jgi:hypothetical protein
MRNALVQRPDKVEVTLSATLRGCLTPDEVRHDIHVGPAGPTASRIADKGLTQDEQRGLGEIFWTGEDGRGNRSADAGYSACLLPMGTYKSDVKASWFNVEISGRAFEWDCIYYYDAVYEGDARVDQRGSADVAGTWKVYQKNDSGGEYTGKLQFAQSDTSLTGKALWDNYVHGRIEGLVSSGTVAFYIHYSNVRGTYRGTLSSDGTRIDGYGYNAQGIKVCSWYAERER